MAGSLRASEEGLRIVNLARRNLGWKKSSESWRNAAFTSNATLKRFWQRHPIKRETFIDICKAVGIDNWEDIIERDEIMEGEAHQFERGFTLPDNLPPVRNWVGRTQAVATLKAQILDTNVTGGSTEVNSDRRDAYPTIAPITGISIVGMAGIGKTTLVSQLLRELHSENAPFLAAAWANLRSPTDKPPPCDRILDSLLSTLSGKSCHPGACPLLGKSETTSTAISPADYLQKTQRLIEILKRKPCILVFDRVETVLQSRAASTAGYIANDYVEYKWLFQQLVATEHQSKILFISRESIAEMPPTLTRELPLTGLQPEAAITLLQTFPLTVSDSELAQLATGYQGHPQALEQLATLIINDSEFAGNVSKFLQDRDWLLIRELEKLTDEIIARLGDRERTCISRISIYQTAEYPLDCGAIAAQMPEVSLYELKEDIIRALKRRHLLSYHPELRSLQLHPLLRAKGEIMLCQNPENLRQAHRQAYKYFLNLPLKPEAEWQEIEDIKPLQLAHYHAQQAEDEEEAAAAISRIECICRVGTAHQQDDREEKEFQGLQCNHNM